MNEKNYSIFAPNHKLQLISREISKSGNNSQTNFCIPLFSHTNTILYCTSYLMKEQKYFSISAPIYLLFDEKMKILFHFAFNQ